MKIKTIENNKPHPQSVSNSYSTKQHHYQQQQQHQQKILVAPSQQSKIPTVQNFNQISKTATNLLNDIYEKHLLNQTKFENVNIMNLYGMTTAASVENNFTRGIRRNGNGGNSCMKNLNVEMNLNPTQHQQLIKQKTILSESVKNQQQFYQSVDTTNLSDYNKPNLNFRQGAVKISHKSRRIDGAGETINQQEKFIRNFNENETIEVMKQIKEHNLMQRTNEISYFQQNFNNNENASGLYTVKEDCPQQNIPKRRATPIGGDLCEQESVKFEYRNSKINLMLETAQAMAAAAYFARLVIFN